MRNIFGIVVLFFGFLLQAQEGVIMPLNTLSMDVQNGTYIKDIDGVFNPFVGTYIGHWNNKKFTLVLQKKEHILFTEHNGDYYYEDRMVGKYEIVNELDNTILYSTIDITEYPDFPIIDEGGLYNGELEFGFYDSDERCRNRMHIRLYNMTTISGVTTVKYWGLGGSYGSFNIECSYGSQESIPKVLPYGHLTLTKVE